MSFKSRLIASASGTAAATNDAFRWRTRDLCDRPVRRRFRRYASGRSVRALALISEIRIKNRLARTLLETYVGSHAGQLSLAGATRRAEARKHLSRQKNQQLRRRSPRSGRNGAESRRRLCHFEQDTGHPQAASNLNLWTVIRGRGRDTVDAFPQKTSRCLYRGWSKKLSKEIRKRTNFCEQSILCFRNPVEPRRLKRFGSVEPRSEVPLQDLRH